MGFRKVCIKIIVKRRANRTEQLLVCELSEARDELVGNKLMKFCVEAFVKKKSISVGE